MSLVKSFGRRPLAKSAGLAIALLAVTAAVAVAATINGTNGNDKLIGTTAADTINGFAGNDIILGLAGNDKITDGNGNDLVFGDGKCPPGTTDPSYCSVAETSSDGSDNITVGNGTDAVFGQGGNDTITVGSGADAIDGGSGNDTINGGSGVDAIFPESGNDTVNTATGTVSVVFAQDGQKDTINCKGNTTVFADRIDVTKGCTKVIYPGSSKDRKKSKRHVSRRKGL
jgi:Ca2+-binding RTX toxin-like protein